MKKTTAHCLAAESIDRAVDAGIDQIEHFNFLQLDGSRVFDDRLTWWYGSDGDEVLTDHDNNPATPMVLRHPGRYQVGWYSVNPPKTGTTMRVEDFQGNGTVKVRVNW